MRDFQGLMHGTSGASASDNRLRGLHVASRLYECFDLVLGSNVVGGTHLFHVQALGDDLESVGLMAEGDEIRRGEIGAFVRGHRRRE